ncbi:mitochondrial basic amino acids transporter [Microplitis demolitor]|uniref:mitochondrial basic amino acids transporter n=1 Tax=Microplitis demolitor TaxID=69319 RepID=UPI00235B5CA2|nr:mitochondrial basic amino acids transporter [Microplitis demolitor]
MTDFVAGCIGGCAGLVVGYPLDTIKVHLQVQSYNNPVYRGTWHCFQSILYKESITGFYRGLSSPLAGVAAINAILFGVYAQCQKFIIKDPENLSSHFLAGAIAGLAQSPVTSPLELAKMRLQLQDSSNPTYSGPVSCLKDIYRNHGIHGIFRGFWITTLRDVPSLGFYFATYEALTRDIYINFSLTSNDINEMNKEATTLHMLIAGGLAGTASWIFTYPIDVIKSRIQADQNGRYKNIVDCFKKSLKDDGLRCLFRGLNSTILRAFPSNAVTFTVVHWTLRLFNYDDKKKHFEVRDNFSTNDHNNNNNNNQYPCNTLFKFNVFSNSILDNNFNLCKRVTICHDNYYLH